MRRKPARSYLSSLYSRMSKAAQAGMRRLRSRANRAGPEHLAADAREFDYIEREARDILDAVARLRARDAAESSGVFEPELALAPETMPITEWAPDANAPPMLDYVEEPMPETRATGNMVRGRRNRTGASRDEEFGRQAMRERFAQWTADGIVDDPQEREHLIGWLMNYEKHATPERYASNKRAMGDRAAEYRKGLGEEARKLLKQLEQNKAGGRRRYRTRSR